MHWHPCFACGQYVDCNVPACFDDDWYDGRTYHNLEVHQDDACTYLCGTCSRPTSCVLLILSGDLLLADGGLLPRNSGGDLKSAQAILQERASWPDYSFALDFVVQDLGGGPVAVFCSSVEGSEASMLSFSGGDRSLHWVPLEEVSDPVLGVLLGSIQRMSMQCLFPDAW